MSIRTPLARVRGLGTGIRHLFWDAGYGFEIEKAIQSGWAVVWSSIILTFLCWLIAAP